MPRLSLLAAASDMRSHLPVHRSRTRHTHPALWRSSRPRCAVVQWLVCCWVRIPAARPMRCSSARVGTHSRTLPPRLMVIS